MIFSAVNFFRRAMGQAAVFALLTLAVRGQDATAAVRLAESVSPITAGPVINLRDRGAIGDGSVHLVAEWIEQKRFPNLRALRKEYPFVQTPDWTIDEAVFEQAKRALPATGGVIFLPAGHYVANHQAWTIRKDHVHLKGAGPDLTILSATNRIDEGLVLSGYRHTGWREKNAEAFPFTADTGMKGAAELVLKNPEWTQEFRPGDLIFIRDGANRYDADYGEFNEVRGVGVEGELQLAHPLARSYTLADSNWAGETTAEFKMPREDGSVLVKIRTEPGFFVPNTKTAVSVDGNLMDVLTTAPGSLELKNPGRGNVVAGTPIAAGSKIARSRVVIKLTESTRDFTAEGLTIIGRRKAANLSNSYETAFVDCSFLRQPGDRKVSGGLTIDGDGGRFATFTRCTIRAVPAIGMQFARSFGSVQFLACHFIDTNVAFTEFNFDCEVRDSTFTINGTPALTQAIIAGKSCENLRFINNRLAVTDLAAVFEGNMDIQSYRQGGGEILVQGNTIDHSRTAKVFALSPKSKVQLLDNPVSPAIEGTPTKLPAASPQVER